MKEFTAGTLSFLIPWGVFICPIIDQIGDFAVDQPLRVIENALLLRAEEIQLLQAKMLIGNLGAEIGKLGQIIKA